MTKEELDPRMPVYEIEEEDDEEIITLDFDNQKAFTIENQEVYIKPGNDEITAAWNLNKENIIEAPIAPAPPVDTFKNELQDLLLNSITSKAVGSLLAKHRDLDNQILGMMATQRMGELGDILETDMLKIMEDRRKELRQCFGGAQIRYDRIPSWARSYVKQYIENMVHELSVLNEDKRS